MSDNIFLRRLYIENDSARVLFISFDLIGLFRDFANGLAARLAPREILASNLIVAATHMHYGPDTTGLWGPSLGESGYNEKYGEFLLNFTGHELESLGKGAGEAIREALLRLASED